MITIKATEPLRIENPYNGIVVTNGNAEFAIAARDGGIEIGIIDDGKFKWLGIIDKDTEPWNFVEVELD